MCIKLTKLSVVWSLINVRAVFSKITLVYELLCESRDFGGQAVMRKVGHWPLCSAAAVASDLIAAPTNTPCCQLKASYTRGTPDRKQNQDLDLRYANFSSSFFFFLLLPLYHSFPALFSHFWSLMSPVLFSHSRFSTQFQLTFRPAPSEDDGLNGDSLRGFPQWVNDGTLTGRSAETRVGVSAGFAWGTRKTGR